MKKSILIIVDSYPPEIRSAAQLMGDMAEELAKRGYKVYVVASCTDGKAGGLSKENGVSVIRTRTLPHHNVNFIMKGISQLVMPWLFIFAAGKYIQEPVEATITHSPPLPLAAVGRFMKRIYGAENILNVHDIFPQNAVDLGIMRNPLQVRFFERMEQKAYKKADLLMVPSETHKEFLIGKRGVDENKIKVVRHWMNMELFEKAERTGRYRKKFNLEDKIVFLFAGVLGPSQGLDMIISAADKLKGEKKIHFLFAGDGSEKIRLQKLAEEKGLSNVTFTSFVPSGEYPYLVKDCDVGLVTLTSDNTTPAVPAKIVGYMAGGLPIAAFLHKESDGLRIVEEAGCGVAAASNDQEAVTRSLEKFAKEEKRFEIYGRNSLKYAREHFAVERAADRVESLLSFRARLPKISLSAEGRRRNGKRRTQNGSKII